MLMPKRVTYRKQHRPIPHGKAQRGNFIIHGNFAIQSLQGGWISSRQIEAARRAITNYVRRGGKVYIRIFPDRPITQKPAETRMGSGKGAPEYWVAVVQPGRILFELLGVREDVAREALMRAAFKLPVRCRFVTRDTVTGAGSEPFVLDDTPMEFYYAEDEFEEEAAEEAEEGEEDEEKSEEESES